MLFFLLATFSLKLVSVTPVSYHLFLSVSRNIYTLTSIFYKTVQQMSQGNWKRAPVVNQTEKNKTNTEWLCLCFISAQFAAVCLRKHRPTLFTFRRWWSNIAATDSRAAMFSVDLGFECELAAAQETRHQEQTNNKPQKNHTHLLCLCHPLYWYISICINFNEVMFDIFLIK